MIKKIYNQRALISKFVTVGIIGFCVNYLVLKWVNQTLGVERVISEVIAAIVALQVTFILNNIWTYKIQNSRLSLKLKLQGRYLTYLATNSLGSLMTVLLFALFSSFLSRLAALATASLIAMVWNFTMNKLIVWRRVIAESNHDDSA